MFAKLLGIVSRVDRLTSIGVANAGEPVLLTDTQLDMAAGGIALVSVSVENANADATFSVSDNPSFRFASITADFTTAGPAPHSGSVSAEVFPTM